MIDARAACNQPIPGRMAVQPERCDETDTCNDDANCHSVTSWRVREL